MSTWLPVTLRTARERPGRSDRGERHDPWRPLSRYPDQHPGAWASGGLRTTSRPRLGVRVQGIIRPASLREAAGQEAGLLVSDVGSRSLAERVGLLVGDVLLDAPGAALEDAASLGDALARSTEATVRLRLMRGGELREVEVDLGSSQARGA